MNLAGKVAVITGGSRGIGKAIASRLADAGAHVYINYVSRSDAAENTVQEIITAGGQAKAVQFDVSDGVVVKKAFKAIVEEAGHIDILVNNAGITKDGLLLMIKDEDWDSVLSTNLKGAYHCMKAVYRPMMKKRHGRIITITSVIGHAGNAGQANYAAAKAGLEGLSRSLARELASRKVTVNTVAPGYIDTDMTNELPEAAREKILGEVPMGVLGTPDDVAAAVLYLASDEAGYVTGQCLHVNGGMFMG